MSRRNAILLKTAEDIVAKLKTALVYQHDEVSIPREGLFFDAKRVFEYWCKVVGGTYAITIALNALLHTPLESLLQCVVQSLRQARGADREAPDLGDLVFGEVGRAQIALVKDELEASRRVRSFFPPAKVEEEDVDLVPELGFCFKVGNVD